MAREWRRAVFAALTAAMLGGACVLGAHFSTQAYAANEEGEEEQDKTPAADNQPDAQSPDAQPKGGKKRQDPAEAQRAVEAALKQVQAGRAEPAVQAMTATLSGGNLPPALMAKAFYVRGLAYRRQGRSAQAISDLNSALWLKGGLGGEDRDEATKERAAAYADAGLAGRGGEAEALAPKTGGSWLSGLFGSSTPPASDPPAPARQPTPPTARVEAAPAARPPAAVTSGWSSTTEVQAERPSVAAAAPPPPPRAAAPAPPPTKAVAPAAPATKAVAPAASATKAAAPAAPATKAAAPAAPPTKAAALAAPPPRAAPPPAAPRPTAKIAGRYLVQLAPVRTEAEARALAAKAKREPALASRQTAIDQMVMGNMGSFYRVRFGPFANAQETQAVCAKLRGSGVDCLPVGQ